MSKIIVITGAGAGLGRTLALRFARDGDTVVLLGRTLAKVEAVAAEIGDRAMAVGCDVTSPDSIKAAFAKIAERFPTIDVLINNAAIFEPSPFVTASDEHILNTINTNLTGAIFSTREAISMMGRGGHVINVTSESIELPFAQLILYQSTKAGLERFSLNLHRELEPTGIRVSIVRAGQMIGEGKTWDVSPEQMMSFAQANAEQGIRLMERPISQFESVTGVFRHLIDMPADLHVAAIQLHARAAG